ncbi:thiamine-binding protein [Clostridium sp. MCC353]|uniref:Ykof family thiamine-binding protein n=1 Tax=Clostridium sp. MCC353 TaxID=2592646 RepID=UPI001C02218F|nr:Ykof family thiamine-binding protein [Clostridium sp. MCC353]MBT9777032.1 thiamine-binding protein [Clostridium sp. MCC353]
MSETTQNHVTYGSCCAGTCGASKDITGCRFTLAPMSDRYIDIILGAIQKVDTSKVWANTEKHSTLYRGKRIHVLDAVKACFVHAYDPSVHMTMEATFSKGCPGDTDAESYLAEDDTLLNDAATRDIHFPVLCKISLYPMGVANYMEHIAHIVNYAIDQGIYAGSTHYVTVLECDIQKLFDYFNYVNAYCAEHISHYVFEATLSVNSPTK